MYGELIVVIFYYLRMELTLSVLVVFHCVKGIFDLEENVLDFYISIVNFILLKLVVLRPGSTREIVGHRKDL